MRIISKKSDYYDGLQEYDGTIYLRNDKTSYLSGDDEKFILKLFKDMPVPNCTCSFDSIEVKDALIFFCGTVYPVYYIHKKSLDMKGVKIYCTDTPSGVSDIIKTKMGLDVKPTREGSFRYYFNKYPFNYHGMLSYKDHINTLGNKVANLFHKTGSPIISVSYNGRLEEIHTDKPLKDFGFQSIVTPFDAYQRIKHYISNDLVSEPLSTFKLSDDLMRDSKGFDKYSFRKMKEK